MIERPQHDLIGHGIARLVTDPASLDRLATAGAAVVVDAAERQRGHSALVASSPAAHRGLMNTTADGITNLDTNTCLGLLRTREVGRLAVAIKEHPDIFPINYVVDRGTIVFRSAEGTKLAAALLGRWVAFEVDGYHPEEGQAWSVVIKAVALEIEQMYDCFDALDLPLFPWHAGSKHHFVRIEPIEITGRRFQVVGHDAWGGDRLEFRRAAPE